MTLQFEKLRQTWRNWSERFLTDPQPIREDRFRKAISDLYGRCDLQEPQLLLLDSPMAIQIAANHLARPGRYFLKKNRFFQEELYRKIFEGIREQVYFQEIDTKEISRDIKRQAIVRRLIRQEVRAILRATERELLAIIDPSTRKMLWSLYRKSLDRRVGSRRKRINRQLRLEVDTLMPFYKEFLGEWEERIAFYDGFAQLGLLKASGFQIVRELAGNPIFDCLPLDGLCIVSRMPIQLQVDDHQRLHAIHESAIRFADGYLQFFFNGSVLGREFFHASGVFRWERILRAGNNRWRRTLLASLEFEELKKLLELELVDHSSISEKGGPLKLWAPSTTEAFNLVPAHFLEVVCPSTKNRHILTVPPDVSSARGAVAWTFGRTQREYWPDLES